MGLGPAEAEQSEPEAPVYLERGVAMAYDCGVAAWSFDLAHWGRCGQGRDEQEALSDLADQVGTARLVVVERVEGDEQAFTADMQPATSEQRKATLTILNQQRAALLALLSGCSEEMLDANPQNDELPSFARWRTLRQRAWHIADTESRYYLPAIGLPARSREQDLAGELRQSLRHVAQAVTTMPSDALRRDDGEVWTSVKVLRRLAWHERGELVAIRELLAVLRNLPT